MFYILKASLILSALFASAAGLGSQIADSQQDQDSILKLHNDFRAQHGASPLAWNDDLVDTAAAWAAECKWEHSKADERDGAGENLYAGTGLPVEDSYNAAAIGWYDEIAIYNFGDPSDLSNAPRGFVDIGHFTAMVWLDTKELGCARRLCPPNEFAPFRGGEGDDKDWVFVVCHYKESGNRLAAGNDEYKLFRQNVVPVLPDAPPVPPIRSCSSDTVTVEISVTAVGATCDAADTLADAIEQTTNTLICRHGWSCSGYQSTSMPFTALLTIEIPKTDVEQVGSTLEDDIRLLEIVWAGETAEASAQAGASIAIQNVGVDIKRDNAALV